MFSGAGASSSSDGCASTRSTRWRVCATFCSISRASLSTPSAFSDIHTLSALKLRVRSSPRSANGNPPAITPRVAPAR
jgi:hypothetical protein